jgi:capsular polysaccharide biosynthesis protein
MRRYVQTFFRHPFLLMAPLVIALALGLFSINRQPRKYLAGATVWCDVPVPQQSTVFTGSSNMPAVGQAAVLTELLQTHSFLAKVAAASPWASLVKTNNQLAGDQVLNSLGSSVSVVAPGPHLLSITVKRPTADEALALAKAATDTYIKEMNDTQHSRAVSSVGFYQLEVDAAQKALVAAQDQLGSYVAANQPASGGPLGAAVDAKITQLVQGITAAQNSLNQAKASQQSATLGLTSLSDAGAIRLYDAPRVSPTPLSRRKVIIFAGVGSVLAGAMVSLFALLYLVVTDTSVRGTADLEEALGLEVVGKIDQFKTRHRGRTRVS